MAALCGLCQPTFAIVSGQLANTLLLLDTDDPEFYREGFKAVIMFVAVGSFLCCMGMIKKLFSSHLLPRLLIFKKIKKI